MAEELCPTGPALVSGVDLVEGSRSE